MRRRSANSNRPMADAITTAASALFGRCCSRSGANTSSSATASAPTTPVSCVLAPAASATGVREELLLIEKPWNSPPARLAAPRPIISWFGSTGCGSGPQRCATARWCRQRTPGDRAAADHHRPRSARPIQGSGKDGRPCGSGPEHLHPGVLVEIEQADDDRRAHHGDQQARDSRAALEQQDHGQRAAPIAKAVQLAWPSSTAVLSLPASRIGPSPRSKSRTASATG